MAWRAPQIEIPSYRVVAWILLAAVGTSGCALFPTEAGEDLAHFADAAPAVGDIAPDVSLTDLDGNPVRLSDFIGDRPVVLQLGSHTCPVYRYRRFDMAALKAEFADRVEFVTLYTTEAHPSGALSPYRDKEWVTPINRLTGVRWGQPGSLAARIVQASESTAALDTAGRVLVDGMDDAAWSAYGEAPSPAYVIDRSGRIALRQVWVKPEGIRAALDRLLE